MSEIIEKPEFVTEEHLDYLDWLRSFGETNMFAAAPYLQKEFGNLTDEQAKKVLIYWMKTFGERHSDD